MIIIAAKTNFFGATSALSVDRNRIQTMRAKGTH
jgi:hypothetical protein